MEDESLRLVEPAYINFDLKKYLTGQAELLPVATLPSKLNLGDDLQGSLEKIDAEKSYVIDPAAEKIKADLLAKIDPAHREEVLGAISIIADTKRQAERTSFLYLKRNGSVDFTQVRHGEKAKVDYNSFDYFKFVTLRGNKLLLLAHTHPSDRLLSPQDYITLIYTKKMALHKWRPRPTGMVVMCPDVQYLALKSSDTANFNLRQASLFVHDWHEYFQEEWDKFKKQNKPGGIKDYPDYIERFGKLHTDLELELSRAAGVKLYSASNYKNFEEIRA